MISLRERLSLLQKAFGRCVLANDGVNVAVRCVNPKCDSRSDPSKLKLTVKLDDELYHCWVCDLKGRRILPLFRKYAPAHLAAARELFSREGTQKRPVDVVEVSVEIPPGFLLLAKNLNSRDPDVKAVLRYLTTRGITEEDLWRFRLGTTVRGRTRRRVIFPSLKSDGEINYWVARTIDENRKPKYLNSKAAKKTVVFNEIDIDFHKRLTLVEGPFDLIKCDENATCLLGSSIGKTYSLFHECARFRTPVLLALDSDMPEKIQKMAKMFYETGCEVEILPLGKFADVGEMSRKQFVFQKQLAYTWTPMDSLYQKIFAIKSGSII